MGLLYFGDFSAAFYHVYQATLCFVSCLYNIINSQCINVNADLVLSFNCHWLLGIFGISVGA